jgi:hypothetical protein
VTKARTTPPPAGSSGAKPTKKPKAGTEPKPAKTSKAAADPTPRPDRTSPIEEQVAEIDPRDPAAGDQVEQLVADANDGADPAVVLAEVGEEMASGGAESSMCEITFRYAGSDAGRVVVAGDFNMWSEHAHPMQRTDGGFEITVPLERGRRYRYRFLVNDRWEDDPSAGEYEPNDFGDRNAICST